MSASSCKSQQFHFFFRVSTTDGAEGHNLRYGMRYSCETPMEIFFMMIEGIDRVKASCATL